MRLARLVLACAVVVGCGSSTPAVQPPSAPTGLTATGGTGTITLSWTAVSGADSYIIQRGESAGTEADYKTSAQAAYTDSGLDAGKTYFYRVQAVNAGGKSGFSNEASAPTIPAAPTGLTVTTTDSGAVVTWTSVTGATGYPITRGVTGSGTALNFGTTSTSFSDTGPLLPNTTYTWTVRAENASGQSATASIDGTTAPAAPTGLTATASNHHVALSWTAAAGATSAGYRVLRGTSSTGPFTPAGTATGTTFTDKLLANNTQYFYTVHTIGGSGESGDSVQANATPFIEICAVDGSSNTVSVYDGTLNGNVAAKRSFGWQTGVAEGTGISVDGVNGVVYIASRYTHSVNIYARTVAGNTAPTSTLALSGEPTAVTYDGTNKELYVAVRGASNTDINVYSTDPALNSTPVRTLTLGGGSVTGVTVIGTQIAVLNANLILMYGRTDSGSGVTPQNTIQPGAPITAFTSLYGGVYDATDDAIWVAYTAFPGGVPTGHATSYSRTTTTVPAPVVKNIDPDPNAPMNNARGLWLDGTSNVWISATNTTVRNQDALYRFSRTTGVLLAAVTGPSTLLYQPSAMSFDSTNNEQWVLNGSAGALAFRRTDSGEVAPRHKLDGSATGIFDPVAIAADLGSGEIVTLNRAPIQSLVVHPSAATGAAAPSRDITGGNTTLSAYDEYSVAVDSGNGEYWVSESRTGLVVFGRSQDGDVAPLRAPLAGTSNFNLGLPAFLAFDPTAGAIVATSPSASVSNQGDLQAWHRTDTGDVAAAFDGTFTLGARQLVALGIDPVHDELFSSDGTVTTVYPRAFASGPLTALRTMTVPGAPAVDAEGDEIYFSNKQSIIVVPRNSNGTPSATRTITGAATALYNSRGVAICN